MSSVNRESGSPEIDGIEAGRALQVEEGGQVGPLQPDGKLLSIQVGLPAEKVYARPTDDHEAVWVSGIDKRRVDGPVELGLTNLAGDGQADLKHHGGPHRAVLLYSAAHYDEWPEVLGVPRFEFGAFGENFTVSGFSEETSCIGDILQIGEVVVQVSQPRGPCWKLGRKHHLPLLPVEVERRGWTGWYVRVLQTGTVEPGQQITLVERLHPQWTITETHRIMRERRTVREEALTLAACPELSSDWQRMLRELD